MDRIPLPDAGAEHRHVSFECAGAHDDAVHLFSKSEILAVNAAVAAGRPLLVRGEPGTGKSQLARAAAKELGWAFVKHVIDSHTESRDLMWTFDAVQRLADAQIAGARLAVRPSTPTKTDPVDTKAEPAGTLDIANYLHPGPLWWAFDWSTANDQCDRARGVAPSQPDRGDWRKGCVLLLDEIDKAEPEVPNGLLEALGAREFTPIGQRTPVRASGRPVLVIITTNEERVLPDPFVRRCLVIRLGLPEDEDRLIDFLMTRGEAHFPDADERVRRQTAKMLHTDRQKAIQKNIRPRPGQAEYLDLLRIVVALEPDNPSAQLARLDEVAGYALRKQAGTADGR